MWGALGGRDAPSQRAGPASPSFDPFAAWRWSHWPAGGTIALVATEPGTQRFLDALDAGHVDELRALGRRRRHPVGEALFREREPADGVLVVLSGRVKLSCVTDTGREALLGIREPGDLLGEMSVIDGEPRSATATAVEPVEVLVVPIADFSAFLHRTPAAADVLLRMLTERLRDADRKRVEYLAQDTVGRVCSRLVELADRFGEPGEDGVRIDLAITQEELAGWTGSSREATIRALGTLRELGWIETRRRRVTLLQPGELRRRAV
jgi:CRP/FNR family transcriptional regulator, cyclic AMP receptor protein